MNKITITLEDKEYQIDIEKAKELGVLKEKDQRCKSWEEFKLKYRNSKGYYSDSQTSEIYNPRNPIQIAEQLTPQESTAIHAFSKLLKLRRDWIEDWNPNWCIPKTKYCIKASNDSFQIGCFHYEHHTFSFPTKEMVEEFLACFKDLFEQCKNIM